MRDLWIYTDDRSAAGLILRDDERKATPAIDRADGITFRIGCFRDGLPMDLSGHTSFRFELRPDRQEPVNLLQLTTAAADNNVITREDFQNRASSHLELDATGDQTNILIEDASGQRKLWAALSALDPEGEKITLGKGWFTVIEPNNVPSDPPVANPAVPYTLLTLTEVKAAIEADYGNPDDEFITPFEDTLI